MDFVAIDFETATSLPTSVCSLGICVVEKNKVVHNEEILMKPVPYEFNDYNILIHGITPEKVADCMTFNYYWDKIKPFIHEKTVVAHNAAFDVGALRCTLDMFNLEYPEFDYICTVRLSQTAYPELPSHKLNNLCDSLGIKFHHHHAQDDSLACALVLLRILEDYKIDSVRELEERFEVEKGQLYPGWKDKKKRKKNGVGS